MDSTQIRKEEKLFCNEHFLTILSGFRKKGQLTDSDKAYNDALADVYDFIIKHEKNNLFQHTVESGKWVRDK